MRRERVAHPVVPFALTKLDAAMPMTRLCSPAVGVATTFDTPMKSRIAVIVAETQDGAVVVGCTGYARSGAEIAVQSRHGTFVVPIAAIRIELDSSATRSRR